jgi:hypothetical protein
LVEAQFGREGDLPPSEVQKQIAFVPVLMRFSSAANCLQIVAGHCQHLFVRPSNLIKWQNLQARQTPPGAAAGDPTQSHGIARTAQSHAAQAKRPLADSSRKGLPEWPLWRAFPQSCGFRV